MLYIITVYQKRYDFLLFERTSIQLIPVASLPSSSHIPLYPRHEFPPKYCLFVRNGFLLNKIVVNSSYDNCPSLLISYDNTHNFDSCNICSNCNS